MPVDDSVAPICLECRRLMAEVGGEPRRCEAFPDGIPGPIRDSEANHVFAFAATTAPGSSLWIRPGSVRPPAPPSSRRALLRTRHERGRPPVRPQNNPLAARHALAAHAPGHRRGRVEARVAPSDRARRVDWKRLNNGDGGASEP